MGVSYNQLVNYALARFVESQKGISRLEERSRRGSKAAFLRALDEVDRTHGKGRTAKPEKNDELPRGYRRKAFLARLEQQKRGGSAAR